ncbi:alpha/beta fold hydrolase [bacterium]|nr:alpha/beta fold hydrolase [bacterium]
MMQNSKPRLLSALIVFFTLALQQVQIPFACQAQNAESEAQSAAPKARGNAPCLSWQDESAPPKAVVLCVHGLGLHNGTYESFGQALSKHGFAVYAIDVRGFGSWMEAKGRGRVDFDACMEDIKKTLKVVRRANKGLPVFILGESMGGAIALRATALYPELIDGLISSVPAADRFKQTKATLLVAMHLLKDPDKPFNMGEDVVNQATENKELRKSWINDPLSKMNLTAKELYQFDSFMKGNKKIAPSIKDKPVLIVQGSNDKLVRPTGTIDLYNRLATKDKKIVLIPDAEHLIFEEAQFKQRDIDTVVSWIQSHMQGLQHISQQTKKEEGL